MTSPVVTLDYDPKLTTEEKSFLKPIEDSVLDAVQKGPKAIYDGGIRWYAQENSEDRVLFVLRWLISPPRIIGYTTTIMLKRAIPTYSLEYTAALSNGFTDRA
jgi:hypothetical protein